MMELIHQELSKEIINVAMEVHNTLRPGLDEKIYENALVVEFNERNIPVQQQQVFHVDYKEHRIGTLIPDLIVDDKVILETKVVTEFTDAHIAQVLGYLTIAELELGMLLNFKKHRLEWKRIVRSRFIA